MKKLKKKSVKGMTLIEIIISILVLGITGTMMCLIGQTVCKMMRETNHLNIKTDAEAPTAIAQDVSNVEADPTTVGQIKITTNNGGFSERTVGPSTGIKKYTTKELGDAALDEVDRPQMSANIVFYEID